DQVAGTLRDFAKLVMRARGEEGLETALARLAEADAVGEAAERAGASYNSWFLRGGSHYERSRCLAIAGRYEEALAEAERAIAVYEEGGEEAESPRAEAVRMAALIEGTDLGRTRAAAARLSAAVDRCRRVGLPEAAEILADLRERITADRG
ncbi:hypothetical protein AB0O00_27840, partial [Kitasatospora sp. NPDC093558]